MQFCLNKYKKYLGPTTLRKEKMLATLSGQNNKSKQQRLAYD